MKSDLPNETIMPAYPLGDANADVKPDAKQVPPQGTPTQPAPPSVSPTETPKKPSEPKTNGA